MSQMQYRVVEEPRCAGCNEYLSQAKGRGPKLPMEIRWYPPAQNLPVSVCSVGCLGSFALKLGQAQQQALDQAQWPRLPEARFPERPV